MDDLNLELEVGDVGIDTYELSSLCIILYVERFELSICDLHHSDSQSVDAFGVFLVSGKQQATPCDQARGRDSRARDIAE